VIESWTGYFVLTDPHGKPLDLGSAEANADANAHASVSERHVFKLYEGAHDDVFWDSHQNEWLGAAVDHLDPPS
jgi:hypothetical protein